jgi:hypothetical protein
VIDANIAQSAGSSDVPVSLYSRECLNEIRDCKHVAVFSQQLLHEWREHASHISRQWWKSMVARRRIDYTEGDEFAHHLDRACACLEKASSKDALRKDFHLIQSALATDKTILSNEKNLPMFVAAACRTVLELSMLHYGNPAEEGHKCIDWIKAGADKNAGRRIDVWGENHLKNG